MFIARKLMPLAAVSILLAACGNNDRGNAVLTVPDTPATRAVAEEIRQQNERREKAALAREAEAKAPTANPSTPLDSYVELRGEAQLMQAYYALSGLPVPWDRLASAVSNDFRNTHDSFARQEILNVLKPRLEEEISGFAKNRYIMIPARVGLNAYDFERKGFPMRGFEPGSFLSFGNSGYVLAYSNSDQFRFAPVGEETLARDIEGVRANRPYGEYRARVYAFARHAADDAGRYTVKAQIVKVVVEKPDGSAWFEF